MSRETLTINGLKAQTLSQKRKIIMQLRNNCKLNVNEITTIIFHQPSFENSYEVTLSKASNGLYHNKDFSCADASTIIKMLANENCIFNASNNTISLNGDLTKPYLTIIKN